MALDIMILIFIICPPSDEHLAGTTANRPGQKTILSHSSGYSVAND